MPPATTHLAVPGAARHKASVPDGNIPGPGWILRKTLPEPEMRLSNGGFDRRRHAPDPSAGFVSA